MQAGRTQGLHRQEIGEQRTVEQVDARRSAENVGAPPAIEAVACVCRQAAAGWPADEIDKGHDVAKTEVQPLGPDWWKGMGGFADEQGATLAETTGGKPGKRK